MTKYNRTGLNRVLSVLAGINQAHLDRIGGSLRKEGLISAGGRGINAPDMSPEDVKNIILGLLATDNSSQAAKAVKEISEWKTEAGKNFGETVTAIFSDPEMAVKVSFISVFRNFPTASIGWSKLNPEKDVDEPVPDIEYFTPGGAKVEGKKILIEASITNGAINTIVPR